LNATEKKRGKKTMTATLKKILESRLTDAHGERDYSAYSDGIIIDFDRFDDYNSGFDFLVKNYGRLVVE